MVFLLPPSLALRGFRGPPPGGQPFGPWCLSPWGYLARPGHSRPVRGPGLAGLSTAAPTPLSRSDVPECLPISRGARSRRLVSHAHLSSSSWLAALLGVGIARGTTRLGRPPPFARSLVAAWAPLPDPGPSAAWLATLPGGAPDLGLTAAWGGVLPGLASPSVPAARVSARGPAAGRGAAPPRWVSSPSFGTYRAPPFHSGGARRRFHRNWEGGPILGRPPPGAALACALPAPVPPALCLCRPVGSWCGVNHFGRLGRASAGLPLGAALAYAGPAPGAPVRRV